MRRLIISALFFAVTLVAVGAAAILPSRSRVETASMPTMQALQANAQNLPAGDFEDRSLENPRETSRSAALWESLKGP